MISVFNKYRKQKMNKEQYLLFFLDEIDNNGLPILVKYKCTTKKISKEQMDNAMEKYLEDLYENDNTEDLTVEEIVKDFMDSIKGIEYSLIDYRPMGDCV